LLWALQQFGRDAVAVTMRGGPGQTNLRPLWRLLYLRDVRREAQRGFPGSDIVHFTNAYVPRHGAGVRVITTIHDIDVVLFPELYPPLYRWHGRRSIETALRRADAVLTVSETSRKAIIGRFTIAPERVTVAGNGLSPHLVAAAELVGEPGHAAGPGLLYVGHLFKKKNLAWLVKSVVAGVRSGAVPSLGLLLAGNPTYGFGEIRKEVTRSGGIASLAINPTVEELVRLYRSASAVVLPSHSEGFGIPLIEAMYFNKPVVASNIPAHVEIAGGYAEFFDLGSADSLYHAIHRALGDVNGEQRARFLRERFPAYLWPSLAEKYIAVYQQMCRER